MTSKAKILVRDLHIGKLYTFGSHWRADRSAGIVQYIGSYQHRFDTGNTWKKHRFLWVKKPVGQALGESTVEIYGENIRGTLGYYNEKG